MRAKEGIFPDRAKSKSGRILFGRSRRQTCPPGKSEHGVRIRLLSLLLVNLTAVAGISFADVRLSGWVRDSAAQAIAGARVTLWGDTLWTESTVDGAFLLEGVPSSSRPSFWPRRNEAALEVSERRLVLHNPRAILCEVGIYDIRGRRVCVARATQSRTVLELRLASGLYVVRASLGHVARVVPLTVVDGAVSASRQVTLAESAPSLGKTPKRRQTGGAASNSRIVCAAKAGFLQSYASAVNDTAGNVVITLVDSSTYAASAAYLNPSLPLSQRVDDLVSRMTLSEKLSQLRHDAAAIERLGVIEYNWWSECLHGVALAYLATVFPQAIGMAATWDTTLIGRVAAAISDEARAKHHKELGEYGTSRTMRGLTFFTPNINIFRDPRWGRGQETYGEDPYLTSRIAVAFVKGLQGDDSTYLKTGATAKHFAVHSGPEELRHTYDAVPSTRDLWQTYLPAFRACVKEAKVRSVMCAYNKLNGTYACQNSWLLDGILRDTWGFEGYVVSDCGADVMLAAGCDIICYLAWPNQELYSSSEPESLIDQSVKRLMTTRFELGMFDPPHTVPYASIPYDVVDCAKHRALARETARKSIVLLKNAGNTLPLNKNIQSIAVVGPHADWKEVYWGNYSGTPSYTVTPLQGIRAKVSSGTTVRYAQGCGLTDSIAGGMVQAQSLAQQSDAVVAVLGLSSESVSPTLEGEKTDRSDLNLPGVQDALLRALHATATPVVLVLVNGGPLSVSWADSNAAAIVEAWYGGQEAGTAIADVVFGDYNPAGRLPVTVYRSASQLPDFADYNMESGRTYRYFTGEPLYPFGFGLSYTTFAYSNLSFSPAYPRTSDTITVTVDVQNTGSVAGDEVVQLYVTDSAATVTAPLRELKGFSRVGLSVGEKKQVSFKLTPYDLSLMDAGGNRVIEPGLFGISVGGGQPGARGTVGTSAATLTVTGTAVTLGR